MILTVIMTIKKAKPWKPGNHNLYYQTQEAPLKVLPISKWPLLFDFVAFMSEVMKGDDMKRPFSTVLALTIATVILCLVPGRAQSQTEEIKPCSTPCASHAVAGGPHIPGTLSTPINWLPFLVLLGVQTEINCT